MLGLDGVHACLADDTCLDEVVVHDGSVFVKAHRVEIKVKVIRVYCRSARLKFHDEVEQRSELAAVDVVLDDCAQIFDFDLVVVDEMPGDFERKIDEFGSVTADYDGKVQTEPM